MHLIAGDGGINLTNLKLLQTEMTICDMMDAYEALVIRNQQQKVLTKVAQEKNRHE